ncbi:fatty-acid-binding protein 1 [Melia azedarach]|uniref:Fatty-acid-binding protein 1 n=1 Tax=Melia azedarach TaxID=155640 RepID=A0ACC1YVI5_MELAZ|nr:fatty-acid-binding protein 1 [Melia azedarach]
MVSLRFPFSFSQPTTHPHTTVHATSSRPFSVAIAAAAAATAAVAGVAVYQNQKHPLVQNAMNFLFANQYSSHFWASLSLAEYSSDTVVDSKTGASFPSVLGDSRKLLGIGLRKKSILGLKNIDVYAFGVYAEHDGVKKLLSEKYGKLSLSELKENKEFNEDLMEADVGMTVRLQIIYGKLSIRSVRSAFEESVGSRLQKFGGSDNKELLQKFTSQFKDEYKIPKGSVIELAKEEGHILRTTIDGNEVGSIQSKLLCRSLLDLYMGEDPFDRKAKEDIELNLATLLQK